MMHEERSGEITHRAEYLHMRKAVKGESGQMIQVEDAKGQRNQHPHLKHTQETWDKGVQNASSCLDYTCINRRCIINALG